ncbi:cell adhesion molecule-related/down-regulated by oncogenes-like [Gigantopelta aegis]|uniref:cell adhesion molecule-related/down-regulated by oncogenes-like n=1 Tax=Gigantopelta aegis TaxID=1735272 RepID=UPI001B889975|nr:cell adhesion molecule-related/down-regulated by oncogenes-like [Gigantopelta aegis]XP_041373328.1 cell adhesion molecule-related/down-regulated by oncogenes-like [Gigantopelta aegis]
MGFTRPYGSRKGETIYLIYFTWLSLAWADMMPSFIEEPESSVISQHAPLTLHCEVAPSSASVRWLFNDNRLDPRNHKGINIRGTNLHFQSVQDTKAGIYQCIATTSAGSIVSRPAVLQKPVLNKFQDTVDIRINATTGGMVVLPCQPPESRPQAYVVFQTVAGQPVNASSRDNYHKLPSGNILIENVQPTDARSYRCLAVNPYTGQKQTANHVISLSISDQSPDSKQETVIVDTTATSVHQTKGQDILLECPTSSYPVPAVGWTKYGGQLSLTRMRQEQGNLRIRNVQIEDAGTYLCHGTDTTVKKPVSLQVTEPPAVHPLKTVVVKAAGDELELGCKVQGRPDPHITWFFNAKKVQTGGNTFSLEKVVPSHAGLYQCLATNDAGVAHATISVEVTGQGLDPSGKSDDIVTGVTESDMAASNNETTEDIVIPIRKPKRKRKPKTHSGRRKNKARRKDKKKKKHRKQARRKLDEKVKLVPPSKPMVTQLSETSIMLNWTVPQNDGLAITFFRVQYKEISPTKSQWRTEDVEIARYTRRYEVSRLKPGGTYKFRIAAVYSNNDNKVGHNSVRFTLQVAPRKEPSPPVDIPKILEAKPIEYLDESIDKKVYAIGVKWRYLPVDSSPIEGFYIYYKPFHSQEKDKQIPILGAGIRQHILDRLTPDTEYSIRMQCFNSAGTSDYSTTVVQRTPASGNPKIPNFPDLPTLQPENVPKGKTRQPESKSDGPARTPDDDDNEPIEGKTDTQLSSETLYLALGIVLAFLFVILIVFMIMCWWRQRKQRALLAMSGVVHTTKFQDQAQRIYSESMRKKYMNGYPLNGLNGLVANGHLPHNHHNKMNINVNPMSDMENTTPDPGKPYPHHGMANGVVPGYNLYQNTSDNNFNTINTCNSAADSPDIRVGGLQGQNCVPQQQQELSGGGDYHVQQASGNLATFHSFSPQGYSGNETDMAPGSEPNCRRSPKYHLPVRYAQTCMSEEQLSPGVGHDGCGDCHGYGGGHHSMDNLSPSSCATANQGKHKRRRKRPQSREHTTKDQATNTDLSSNEGTIEFSTFSKSPSNGSRTFINNGTQCSDVLHTNVDL